MEENKAFKSLNKLIGIVTIICSICVFIVTIFGIISFISNIKLYNETKDSVLVEQLYFGFIYTLIVTIFSITLLVLGIYNIKYKKKLYLHLEILAYSSALFLYNGIYLFHNYNDVFDNITSSNSNLVIYSLCSSICVLVVEIILIKKIKTGEKALILNLLFSFIILSNSIIRLIQDLDGIVSILSNVSSISIFGIFLFLYMFVVIFIFPIQLFLISIVISLYYANNSEDIKELDFSDVL